MREIQGFFDKLFLTESRLGPGQIEGGNLIVPVSGLEVWASHPLVKEGYGYGPHEGELIFEGVVDSRRVFSEYDSNFKTPKDFKAPREVIDDIPVASYLEGEIIQEYGFEGTQNEPRAWIHEWIVHARSFKLRVHALSSSAIPEKIPK